MSQFSDAMLRALVGGPQIYSCLMYCKIYLLGEFAGFVRRILNNFMAIVFGIQVLDTNCCVEANIYRNSDETQI